MEQFNMLCKLDKIISEFIKIFNHIQICIVFNGFDDNNIDKMSIDCY